MKNNIIYFVVFICGAAVLAIELLGTRIIGPFYGVSLFLWSALISVTLVALSAGYMIGGRIADRRLSYTILGIIIALSGVLVILIPFYRNAIITITEDLGLRTAVLISSFILFFPPLTLLGMVSPYAIKLRTETLDKVGTRAGDLYAISTIGSVIAALVTGFVLIPNVGVLRLTIIIGVLLLLTAGICFVTDKKGLAAGLISGAAILIYFIIPLSVSNKNVVYSEQSAYGEIKVMDIEESRFMLIDGGIHTVVDKRTFENQAEYVWVIDLIKNIKGYSGDLLLIGLGGGSILKSFYNDNWDVEAVEIDPAVTNTAYNYFGLGSEMGNIYHQDGREYLKKNEREFDAVVFDAFGSSSVPFHLVTRENFQLAKTSLQNDGIIAVNLEAIGWDDIIVSSVAATLKSIFRNVQVLPISEPPNTLGNVIILASDSSLELKEEIFRDYTDPDYRFSDNYERAHAWDNGFEVKEGEGIILTDDLNPVEIWSDRINLQARKELHGILGESSFAW